MHNLRAHPYATVEVHRRSQRVYAAIVEGPERRALWPRLREAMPPIANYEAHTSRIIPVVRLVPIAEAPSHSDGLRHQEKAARLDRTIPR
jgi:hypothetical protein